MISLSYDPNRRLPTAEELPHSDDTPVDNELQNLIPNLLDDILSQAWAHRDDWYWAMDMGVYVHPDHPALIPDGFLSLGVPRIKGDSLRLSYVLWEEADILPILFLEVVSQKYGGEYDKKMDLYAAAGILYYVVYNPLCHPRPHRRIPRRHRHRQPLEVCRLTEGHYQLVPGNPIWMPEVGLGIGWEVGRDRGRQLEFLYWYDQSGQRYPSTEELKVAAEAMAQERQQQVEQAQQQAQQAQQQAQRLADYLRSQGIDPDQLL